MLFGYSKIIVPIIFYVFLFVAVYFSFTKNKEYALYFTLPLFSLPNVRMKLAAFPLGKDFIDIVYISIIVSLALRGEFSLKIKNSFPIIAYMLLLTFSFFIVGDRLDGNIVSSQLKDYKNYMLMPLTYFVFYNAVQKLDRLKVLFLIMVLTFIAMGRSSYGEYGLGLHHNFVSEQRPGGVFEADGLGSNHLGAYMAEYTMVLIGICAFAGRRLMYGKYNLIYLFWFAMVANFYSLLFSFSRGAWFGALTGLVFLGIFKIRKVVVMLIVLVVFWQQLLPNSVVQRLEMTEQPDTYNTTTQLDAASTHRLEIWEHALDVFGQNPVAGSGLYTFQYFDGTQLWLSTHNQYLAFMSETGIMGLSLFLLLFFLAFRSGWRLYKISDDKVLQGLGLGFCACVIAAMVSNIFGDRWTFLSLQALYWVLWALVEKSLVLERSLKAQAASTGALPAPAFEAREMAAGGLRRV